VAGYVRGLPGAVRIRRAVNEARSAEEMLNCLCL